MITLITILLALLTIALIVALILGIGGVAFLIVFGDIAICIFIIAAFVKRLKKKKNKK